MGKLGRWIGHQNLRAWKLRNYSQPIKSFESVGSNVVQHADTEDAHAVDPVNHRHLYFAAGRAGKEDPVTDATASYPNTSLWEHWQAYADSIMFANYWYHSDAGPARFQPDWYNLSTSIFNQGPAHFPTTASKLTNDQQVIDNELYAATAINLRDERDGIRTLTFNEKMISSLGPLQQSHYRRSRGINLITSKFYLTFKKRNQSDINEDATAGDINESFGGDFIIGYQSGKQMQHMIQCASIDGVDIRGTAEINNMFPRKCVPVATAIDPHCNGVEYGMTRVASGTDGGSGTPTLDTGHMASSIIKAKRWCRDDAHTIGNLKPYYVDKSLFTVVHQIGWSIPKGSISSDYQIDIIWNGEMGLKMIYYQDTANDNYSANLMQNCLDLQEKTIEHNNAPSWMMTVWGDTSTWLGSDYIGPGGNLAKEKRVVDVYVRAVHGWRDVTE